MNAPIQLLLIIGLAMLSVFVGGVYMTNRKDGISSSDSWREALVWGGGFSVYAVFDYIILMH